MRERYGEAYPRDLDVLILGAGLSGCLAAVAAKEAGREVLVLSKVHPLRSHSCAAQGGINAALYEPDTGKHADDTLRGSDYLADREAVELLCAEAPAAVRRLDAMGATFSRTEDGRIAQRPFGGQGAARTCYAKDRTGLACLQTAYERALRAGVRFLDEWYVTDLLYDPAERRAYGAVAFDIRDSRPVAFASRTVIVATGGYGRAFKRNSNAHANTGDALSLALRRGLPLEDMECVQFHPTGLAESGILISEAARGEGGYLVNAEGRRFMEDYAPLSMELAPRDVVSRAIEKEIIAGRGVGPGKGAVHLALRHLGSALREARLPELLDIALCFQAEDMARVPVRVAPTAHYSMGGIPVDLRCRARTGVAGVATGLFAAGECACVSVHGANRLGGNSLLEALVFGERAGRAAAEDSAGIGPRKALPEDLRQTLEELSSLRGDGTESLAALRTELQESMSRNVGIFRDEAGLAEETRILERLGERLKRVKLRDASTCFNTEMREILELGHMIDYSKAIAAAAIARKESRGAHFRTDYPERNDEGPAMHSLAFARGPSVIVERLQAGSDVPAPGTRD